MMARPSPKYWSGTSMRCSTRPVRGSSRRSVDSPWRPVLSNNWSFHQTSPWVYASRSCASSRNTSTRSDRTTGCDSADATEEGDACDRREERTAQMPPRMAKASTATAQTCGDRRAVVRATAVAVCLLVPCRPRLRPTVSLQTLARNLDYTSCRKRCRTKRSTDVTPCRWAAGLIITLEAGRGVGRWNPPSGRVGSGYYTRINTARAGSPVARATIWA